MSSKFFLCQHGFTPLSSLKALAKKQRSCPQSLLASEKFLKGSDANREAICFLVIVWLYR